MSKAATHLWYKDGIFNVWAKQFVVLSDSMIRVYESREDYESQKEAAHRIQLSTHTQLLNGSDSIMHQGWLIKKGKLKWNEKWCALVNYGYLKYVADNHGIRSIDFSKASFKLEDYGNLIYWIYGGDRVYFRCDSPSIQVKWHQEMKEIQANCMQIRYQYEQNKLLHKEPTLFAFCVDNNDGKQHCFCAPDHTYLAAWHKCISEQISRSDLQIPQPMPRNIKIVSFSENDITYIASNTSHHCQEECGNANALIVKSITSSFDETDEKEETIAIQPIPPNDDDNKESTFEQEKHTNAIETEIRGHCADIIAQIVNGIDDVIDIQLEYDEYGSFMEGECDGHAIEHCHSLKRIILILNIYKQHMEMERLQRNNNALSQYLNIIKYDLLNDYHHILDAHLSDDHIMAELCCDINDCVIYERYQRQRETSVSGNDEYVSIYFDLLDTMHCYFRHSNSVWNDNDRFQNKFITVPPNAQVRQHRFGRRFEHYWDKWKNPKYETLKDELMDNTVFSIDLDAFNQIYKKSNYLLKNSEPIKRVKSSKQSKYAMDAGLALNISNILSVSLYTDYDDLSHHFCTTFYCNSNLNDEYFNWSKLLCETVNGYGITMDQAKVTRLFHYCKSIYLTDFATLSLNAPTSTLPLMLHTQLQNDAILNNDHDGMTLMLELKTERKTSKYLRHLNCTLFSSFPSEHERLFMNPPATHSNHLLELISIRNLSTNEDYQPFICALNIFNKLVDKEHVPHISSPCAAIINNLMANNGIYPQYILDCFQKWAETKTQMVFNLKMAKQFGINSLFHPNTKKRKQLQHLLNFQAISIVFKNVKWIICERVGEISDAFLDLLLQEVDKINELHELYLDKIYLYDIPNIHEFTQTKQYAKYQSLFSEKNWNIQTKNGYCSDYLVVSK
eukprot:82209_1